MHSLFSVPSSVVLVVVGGDVVVVVVDSCSCETSKRCSSGVWQKRASSVGRLASAWQKASQEPLRES